MLTVGGTWAKRFDVTKADGTAGTATVTVSVTLPDGTVTPVTPTFTAPNHYDALMTTTQVGRHTIAASATGGDLGSFVATWPLDVFHVDSAVTMVPLVGLDEARIRLNISKTTSDSELLEFIGKASASVEARTKLWHRTTVVDVFPQQSRSFGRRYVFLRQAPVVSLTSVVEDGITVDSSMYLLDGNLLSGYWFGRVVVTYVAGETVVPLDVREGVLMLLEHMWATQRGPVTRAASFSAADTEYDPRSTYAWPRRVQEQLSQYLKPPLVGG